MKRIICILIIVMMIVSISSCAKSNVKTLNIVIPKVGKADSIIMTNTEHSVIIDSGEEDDYSKIATAISNLNIRTVDALILTHFDKDHIGSAYQIVRDCDVKLIITSKYVKETELSKKLIEEADKKGIEIEYVGEDTTIDLGGLHIEIFAPNKDYNDSNDNSIIVYVNYLEKTLVSLGDITEDRIYDEVTSFRLKEADIVKLPHHGSYEPSLEELLIKISPSYAVVCDSKKNPMDDETVTMLDTLLINLYETKNNSINIKIDDKVCLISEME